MNRFIKIILVIGFYVAASAAAFAQVYQWKDSDAGTTRFSNTAPRWYGKIQMENRAPRVQVFYYGVLVDDTNLAYDIRQAMRSQSPIGRYLPRLILPETQQAKR